MTNPWLPLPQHVFPTNLLCATPPKNDVHSTDSVYKGCMDLYGGVVPQLPPFQSMGRHNTSPALPPLFRGYVSKHEWINQFLRIALRYLLAWIGGMSLNY